MPLHLQLAADLADFRLQLLDPLQKLQGQLIIWRRALAPNDAKRRQATQRRK